MALCVLGGTGPGKVFPCFLSWGCFPEGESPGVLEKKKKTQLPSPSKEMIGQGLWPVGTMHKGEVAAAQ